jgi:hypothetical protein
MKKYFKFLKLSKEIVVFTFGILLSISITLSIFMIALLNKKLDDIVSYR